MPATASQQQKKAVSKSKIPAKFMLACDEDYVAIPLDIEEGDDVKARISSVIPLITKRCIQFRDNLRPRERAHYELQDLIQEMWSILLEKDHYFDRRLGAYITFIDPIISQQLASIRNKCHVVTSPRDTAHRLQKMEKQRPELLQSIKHAISDVCSLDEARLGEQATEDLTVQEVIAKEQYERTRRQVQRALEFMHSPLHILVLSLLYGLNTHVPHTARQIAVRMRCSLVEVMRLEKEAKLKMACILMEQNRST